MLKSSVLPLTKTLTSLGLYIANEFLINISFLYAFNPFVKYSLCKIDIFFIFLVFHIA